VHFHVIFNVTLAVLFLGLTDRIAAFVERWLPIPADAVALTKPKFLDEAALETPVLALANAARETLRIGDIQVDTVERRVRLNGDAVHLTPTEYELLLRLAERPGQVLDRDRLLNDVWGWSDGASTTRTVDSHVRALRRKLGDNVIRTVHGVGYALDTP